MSRGPIEERFAARIRIDEETGCWLWIGCIDRYGYGRVKVAGKNRQTHRVMWELLVGEIPSGYDLDHLKGDRGPCRSRACCNPEHLEPVTKAENSRRVHRDKKEQS